MSRSSPTCSTARSSAGRYRGRYKPSWPSTLCRWESISANVQVATCSGWCTIGTAQYRAIRYGEAPAGQDAVASVGSKVDSYDNALTETLNTLYKAELIRNKGAWKGIDDVELAAAERVHWFNTYRPHRSTWCSDSLCVPIRLFQCAAAGCVARARADD
ncbi:integrase core domain-containing protein [Brevibacterium aurantiacum]|uniref:Uncharacterized protein n=1 Tax=Brevibacterium aurantiacum TaxID=273384 RepID=A0A2A3ZH85_BREAU|nr:hypothetical protein CIK62_05900 [Brevibacterium aurantiacum]RCS95708.1 hypothetical protein CIK60_15880 [Brevibacterium aurantiacum]